MLFEIYEYHDALVQNKFCDRVFKYSGRKFCNYFLIKKVTILQNNLWNIPVDR